MGSYDSVFEIRIFFLWSGKQRLSACKGNIFSLKEIVVVMVRSVTETMVRNMSSACIEEYPLLDLFKAFD